MMEEPTIRYSMLIRWSDEDEAFLVALPEWRGWLTNWESVTHGLSHEGAARNGCTVLAMLVEQARAEGTPLPEPHAFAAA